MNVWLSVMLRVTLQFQLQCIVTVTCYFRIAV